MKYHSSLIKKYISVNDTPENIAQNLIVKTCEIEDIIERKISDFIVIWYVKSCEKHTDADKLSVCIVDCWNKWEYQIICGWSNVRTWIYVPVALPGTVFDKIGMTIEKRKMRWIESNWMICSKEELEINEDQESHGIWDLLIDFDDISDADLGTPLAQKFPWLNSYVFDVENKWLTNRPDLTGHFWVAIELNAIYGAQNITFNKVLELIRQFKDTNILENFSHANPAQKKIIWEAPGLNTYTVLEINNIEIKPLSFFTRLQLLDLWSKSINNWVDFSNLFMLLTGQPIHFFDADKVDGNIVVRNAKDGETFIDLFETEHNLKSSDIVIADESKILALAWVVWWLESWVSENTKNILVEIANFDPVAVRKTGTRLGLRTDAELRYEKNINPWWSMYCLLLFLDELKYYNKDLWSFEIWGISYYVKDNLKEPKNKEINVDLNHIEKTIFWTKIENFEENATKILKWLWFETKENSVICPIRRSPNDINIQEDVTEEIIRIYGYEKILWSTVLSDIKYIPYTPIVELTRALEDIFIQDFHFDQTESYPWTNEKTLKQFGTDPEQCYSLQNPVNIDTPYLRDSMIYNLLGYAAKNSKFFDSFKIFDIGSVWHKNLAKKSDDDKRYAISLVNETLELGALVYEKSLNIWNNDPFLTIKSLLTPLLQRLEINETLSLQTTNHNYFHPKKQSDIILGWIVIGSIASLHPLVLKEHKINETAWLCYISLSLPKLIEIRNNSEKKPISYETLQEQIIWRDLCFVVDSSDNFDSILKSIKNIKEISALEVFDAYEGKNLGENKKSISIKIKIIGDWNLTTEQINEIMNKAISCAEKAGWSLRA